MAQLKNYPLIAQITILTDNNPHFKKKGQDVLVPTQIHKTLSHHQPPSKKGERTTKYPISNKLVTTQIPK